MFLRVCGLSTLSLASLFLVVGCTPNTQPVAEIFPTVPAEGTLTFDGQPVPDFVVTLVPTDGKRPASGRTDASGKFVLGTNQPGDGAPAGTHRASVAFSPPEDPNAPPDAGGIEDPSKMPKPKFKIPAKYSNPETSGLNINVPEDGTTDLKIELKK